MQDENKPPTSMDLVQALKGIGYSYTDIAKLAGATPSTIARIATGQKTNETVYSTLFSLVGEKLREHRKKINELTKRFSALGGAE